MKDFFIVTDSDDKVLSITEREELDKEYKIGLISSDSPPSVGDTFSIDYKAKRKINYIEKSDRLLLEYLAQKEDDSPQEDVDSAKQAWLDKKQQIKEKYPKP